jgi:hypothetical protein
MRHIVVAWADSGKSVSIPDHIVITRRFDLQPSRVISASGYSAMPACESCPFSALSGNERWLCGQAPHRCVGQSNPANVQDGQSSNSVVRDLRPEHQPAFHSAVQSLVSGPTLGKMSRRSVLARFPTVVAFLQYRQVPTRPNLRGAKGPTARLCGLVSDFFKIGDFHENDSCRSSRCSSRYHRCRFCRRLGR